MKDLPNWILYSTVVAAACSDFCFTIDSTPASVHQVFRSEQMQIYPQQHPSKSLSGTIQSVIKEEQELDSTNGQEKSRQLCYMSSPSSSTPTVFPKSSTTSVDNPNHLVRLQQHYKHQEALFATDHPGWIARRKFLQDYKDNAIVYQVWDERPATYVGKSDILKQTGLHACQRIVQHVQVNHNHAQVVWKAETETATVYGTDSYALDPVDHKIVQETIVAVSEPKNGK